jgi:hypothetical protein
MKKTNMKRVMEGATRDREYTMVNSFAKGVTMKLIAA